MRISFEHRQSAHCESGVTANLLSHAGLDVSEAMVFGVGAGLFFAYLPFVKVAGLPLTTYRNGPGAILKKSAKRLGFNVVSRRYRDPSRAMRELDEILEKGEPAGCQTGVYWLPYFPPALRFHFNAHNLVVFGKEGHEYLISDPTIGEVVSCHEADLEAARFAKGPLAPKGRMYAIEPPSAEPDWGRATLAGIRETCRMMVRNPLPIAGISGMRFLAKRMVGWPDRLGERKASMCVGQLIRMQEEIGTGGGGFRFIFAAFLQETAKVTGRGELVDFSEQMTVIGDRWRDLAVAGARVVKGRSNSEDPYAEISRLLMECADLEEDFFGKLEKWARGSER